MHNKKNKAPKQVIKEATKKAKKAKVRCPSSREQWNYSVTVTFV